MPPVNRGAPKDGRLNLEQQKKRAKELLAAFNAGEADARERFAEHSRATAPKLADAQFVIAREIGFASWPELKEHADALAAARAAMEHAPDTPGMLHIRCGTDIERDLRTAGFRGRFHEFSDPFCQGPVRALPRATFIAERSAFLAGAYGEPDASTREDNAYAIFDQLGQFEAITLWFEHDSYDQLILAYLLAEFALLPGLPPVQLVCVDDVPAVPRFVGLGQLSAEVIRWLWPSRRMLGPADFAYGQQAWRAIASPDPRALLKLAQSPAPISPMPGAMMRHLMELPSTHNGLGLVEQLALETIADHEGAELRALFRPYMDREPLPFLGDTMFAHIVRDMAAAGDSPLVLSGADDLWRSRASLTPTGRALLANERDWLDCRPPPRWVGGVEITGAPAWRFDHAGRSVVKG